MQFLRGYTILLADPVVASINDLDRLQRADYLSDMALIGDVLLEVTDAYRINYGILGNSDPLPARPHRPALPERAGGISQGSALVLSDLNL